MVQLLDKICGQAADIMEQSIATGPKTLVANVLHGLMAGPGAPTLSLNCSDKLCNLGAAHLQK